VYSVHCTGTKYSLIKKFHPITKFKFLLKRIINIKNISGAIEILDNSIEFDCTLEHRYNGRREEGGARLAGTLT